MGFQVQPQKVFSAEVTTGTDFTAVSVDCCVLWKFFTNFTYFKLNTLLKTASMDSAHYLIDKNHDITHYVCMGQHGVPQRIAEVHKWRAILFEHRVVLVFQRSHSAAVNKYF